MAYYSPNLSLFLLPLLYFLLSYEQATKGALRARIFIAGQALLNKERARTVTKVIINEPGPLPAHKIEDSMTFNQYTQLF